MSATAVPEENEAEQPWLLPVRQEIPCGLLTTAPVPVPLKLTAKLFEVFGGVPPCDGTGVEEVPNALHPIKKARADSRTPKGRKRTTARGIVTSRTNSLSFSIGRSLTLQLSLPVSSCIRDLGFPITREMGDHRRYLECHLVAHRLQAHRFAFIQFDVVIPRVEFDAAPERQGGNL